MTSNDLHPQVLARDDDIYQMITYELVNGTENFIVDQSGSVSTKPNIDLSVDLPSNFDIVVRATDNGQFNSQITILSLIIELFRLFYYCPRLI